MAESLHSLTQGNQTKTPQKLQVHLAGKMKKVVQVRGQRQDLNPGLC